MTASCVLCMNKEMSQIKVIKDASRLVLLDQLFCVLSSVDVFCTCNPFVNQGLFEVGTQSVSVCLCNNGCVVMFARLIYSNTLTAILKLCYPEKQQQHEHYIVWPKPLNVKVNIGSLQHCRHEMVILCCVCVCVFAFVCLLLGYISSFSDQVS